LPHKKHNSTKDDLEPLRLRVHLVAHPVGRSGLALQQSRCAIRGHSDRSSQLNCEHALVSWHALNMEPKVSMCLFAHRTERFLSQLIRWSGLTGWLLSLLFALSGLRAVLPPTEKARRAVGTPIARSTVAPTIVLLALPI